MFYKFPFHTFDRSCSQLVQIIAKIYLTNLTEVAVKLVQFIAKNIVSSGSFADLQPKRNRAKHA